MVSLRTRLSLLLVAATGLIWLCASIWIYAESKVEIERVLDTRLQESARMVASLAMPSGSDELDRRIANPSTPLSGSYAHQLSCQIWSFDGKLISKSSGAPQETLAGPATGFSDRVIDSEPWRVYTVEDQAKGIRVMVGDSLTLRSRLIADLLKGLLIPMALIIPFLALAIWASIAAGLRPLDAIADELRHRSVDDMKPLKANRAPREISPLVNELNKLFGDVDAARRHERELTAFAAHELKTPIAGLKAQVQVALATTDPQIRDGALQQIVVSIDRTSRLMQQMLTTARLESQAEFQKVQLVNLSDLLKEIVLHHPAGNRAISVRHECGEGTIETDRELLTLALRNLHENAVQHTSDDGSVVWSCSRSTGHLALALEDNGPGIPEDELPLVFNRFYRGKRKSSLGSGLGLAITDIALKRLGGTITLQNRSDTTGLRVEISLPYSIGENKFEDV